MLIQVSHSHWLQIHIYFFRYFLLAIFWKSFLFVFTYNLIHSFKLFFTVSVNDIFPYFIFSIFLFLVFDLSQSLSVLKRISFILIIELLIFSVFIIFCLKADQNQFPDFIHHFHLHNYLNTSLDDFFTLWFDQQTNFRFAFHLQHGNPLQAHSLSSSYIFDILYNSFPIPPFF